MPPVPLYPLWDFKALYKYCIIIIIIMMRVWQSPRDTVTAGVGVGVAQQAAAVTNLYTSPEYVPVTMTR